MIVLNHVPKPLICFPKIGMVCLSDCFLFLLKGNHFGGIYIGDAINSGR
jgi:hypothetical protein